MSTGTKRESMENETKITRWILDTRDLWPGESIREAAAPYLSLLPKSEQKSVTSKFFIKDARLSLASALLKRIYITQETHLPWHAIRLTRRLDAKHGKPCFSPPATRTFPHLDFNISHQRGILVLIGASTPPSSPLKGDGRAPNDAAADPPPVQVAVDVTAPNERRDMAAVAGGSWAEFVGGFEGVFSEAERFALTYRLPGRGGLRLWDGREVPFAVLERGRADRVVTCGETLRVDGGVEVPSELIVEEKLRVFYTAFALKEAYLKLRGEGIAAEWIAKLEFGGVRAPERGGVLRCGVEGTWGERIVGAEELEVTVDGERVEDVAIEVQALEEDYIIASMVRPHEAVGVNKKFPDWDRLSLEKDVWNVAMAAGALKGDWSEE